MKSRTIATWMLLSLAVAGMAQGWSDSYGKALKELRDSHYSEARALFKEAASLRSEDFSGPTMIGGSVTEPTFWRKGKSYSPNFAAAYAGYKSAMKTANDAERNQQLGEVAAELETLFSKNQPSREANFVLVQVYTLLGKKDQAKTVGDRPDASLTWKVDDEILSVEDRQVMSSATNTIKVYPKSTETPNPKAPIERPPVSENTEPATGPSGPAGPKPVDTPKSSDPVKAPTEGSVPKVPKDAGGPTTNPTVEPDRPKTSSEPKPTQPTSQPKSNPTSDPVKPRTNPTQDSGPAKNPKDPKVTSVNAAEANTVNVKAEEMGPTMFGEVVVDTTKYALVIGNSDSKIPGGTMNFAGSDSEVMRDTLSKLGGYASDHITVLNNVTAAQMLAAAKQVSDKIPDGGTVFIFFTGVGQNVDGKDYLAGVDTALATDTSTMLEKAELYKTFMVKGARIFAFFQSNRPFTGRRCFGQEVPLVGSISQMQATVPGGMVHSMFKEGKEVGLFTNAVRLVLNQFRSNRIPIYDFGWNVFDNIKRGDTGASGGGATQVPTLPVLTNMAPDARF